ncbi:hypothetical protein BAUCODRAFT_318806 [Baudoinia panamericana UAMH 10762]|uniref:Mitochondrial presequence protease n=1 Tax=Baudoinia panamericana (strain UAMH 10762) TaxID=717646 RepID=M2MIW9_BAUPA|nr:uncharacterized protein BAUCODRAFT_318806 [Baudoinia panamericana UAMH 10762]EMC91218.1 hypothetical protein BAUCODRAFT_318806 [Baudoinia panamericana UAMH 10762]
MPSVHDEAPRFRTVQKLQLEYAPVTITQYESARTGMRVAVVDQPGPKINGYFAVATEIHDDSGAPHTLEHLVFMGSKQYHYKGLLDKLATRMYSTTNAWTSVDNTTYTLDTAGWAAFAQMLPVYLDHLIVPTLTDAGCYTEVHHIDGEGNDAGVVYSEMQATQNTSQELMDLELRRLMYPEGNGYRYETGGMMEALRVLTADRIRSYHKEMYQPKNMRIILTGEVDHNELLAILDRFESSIMEDVPSVEEPFQRPWITSSNTPRVKQTSVKAVYFPEEDESMGDIMIGYVGPRYDDHEKSNAMAVLTQYLCGSSISVLENTLVEQEQLCSMVYCQSEERLDSALIFYLSAVETDRLADVEKRFVALLKDVANQPLNMGYLHDCLKRLRRQVVARSENAGDFFSTLVLEDHLYGDRAGRDLKHLESLKEFDDLALLSEDAWRELLRGWLANAEHISILGVPSKELSEKTTANEKARVEAQRAKLGEQGMLQLAEQLKQAQAENNRPIPESLLEQFKVPDAETIHFISTTTARAGAARKMGKLENNIQTTIDKDDNASSLFIHFEHIPSNFVRINLNMCTAMVPIELKPLLTLYLANFFTTPVMRDGARIEFEDVVLELERETVSYSINTVRGNVEMLSVSFEAESDRYESIISWLRTMLFDAIDDPVRLSASLTKILADIPEEKRDADSMAMAVLNMEHFERTSSGRAQNTLSKALYLRRIRNWLKADEQMVLDKFKQLRQALHKPENFRVYVAANIEKLSRPVSAWNALTDGLDMNQPLRPLDDRKACLSDIGKNPGSLAYFVPLAATDSSFAVLAIKGPEGLTHPDVPALRVAAAYMDAVEGPLWNGVRGPGLAYGTFWRLALDTGVVTFTIYRSPDTYKAWTKCKEQVEGYASGELRLEKLALEGAISEIVLGMANEQPTMASAADASYLSQVIRGVPKDWNHQMLAKVRAVTPEQVKEAMKRYMVPAFNPATCNMFVTCAQVMCNDLVARFEKEGFRPQSRTLESFQDDYGLEPPDGNGEEADDAEDIEDGEDDEDDEPMDTPDSDEE